MHNWWQNVQIKWDHNEALRLTFILRANSGSPPFQTGKLSTPHSSKGIPPAHDKSFTHTQPLSLLPPTESLTQRMPVCMCLCVRDSNLCGKEEEKKSDGGTTTCLCQMAMPQMWLIWKVFVYSGFQQAVCYSTMSSAQVQALVYLLTHCIIYMGNPRQLQPNHCPIWATAQQESVCVCMYKGRDVPISTLFEARGLSQNVKGKGRGRRSARRGWGETQRQ